MSAPHDNGSGDAGGVTPGAIEAELERLIAHPSFAQAPRLIQLLQHVVRHSLRGDLRELKEYALGIGVFNRGKSFDPRTDNIVRAHARRLRQRLEAYYQCDGRADPIVIELPKGHYVARFRCRVRPTEARRNAQHRSRAALGQLATIGVDQFYCGEGRPRPRRLAKELHDDIEARLVSYPELRTIAWPRNDGTTDYVIDGSIRRRARLLTLCVRIRRSSDDEAVWSREFKLANELSDRAIDDLAQTISRWLRLQLTHDVECERVRRLCTSTEAAQLYRQAHAEQLQISQGGAYDPVMQLLNMQRAAQLDVGVAQIHKLLANAYLWAWAYRRLPYQEAHGPALAAMSKALELNPRDPDSLVALASIQTHFSLAYAAAEDSLRRAIALNPNVRTAHNGLGEIALRQGRPTAAVQHYERSLRSVDGDARLYSEYAKCLNSVGRFEDAVRATVVGLGLVDTGYYRVALTEELVFAQVRLGDLRGANESVNAAIAAIDARLQPYLGGVLAEVGQHELARAMLMQLETRRSVGPSAVVHGYTALAECQRALEWTMKAVSERDALVLGEIRSHPRYLPLRDHPQWLRVMSRLEALEAGSSRGSRVGDLSDLGDAIAS
jgi:tetratricopeptide (TPR) repeat protein